MAALNLVLPGHRVVDLGTEDSFQFLCQRMAELNRNFRDVFIDNMKNSYDRRIPAVLYADGLELSGAEGRVGLGRETYYTSAIWNIVADRVKQHRENNAVLKIKMIVPIGAGTTPNLEEERLLLDQYALIRYTPDNMGANLKCTPAELLEILDFSPIQVKWEGESNQEFLDKCLEMVRIWTPATVWKQFKGWWYDDAYGNHEERCEFAVNLSIPSRVMKNRIQLMINCINHHSSTTIFDLRMRTAQYLSYPELRTYVGRRLFTCWLDFATRREKIQEAQPPPTVVDVDALPENVMATSAPTSASTAKTVTAPSSSSTGASGTTTATSAAETRSSAQSTQAVESASTPTSRPPGQPAEHLPLNIPPTVPDWLANLNTDLQERRAASPVLSEPRRTSKRVSASKTATTPTLHRPTSVASSASTASLQTSPVKQQAASSARAKTPPQAKPPTSTSGRTTPTVASERPQTRSRTGLSPPAKNAPTNALEQDE